MAETGGRAVERTLTLPVTPARRDDRRQAAVCRQHRSAKARPRRSMSSSSRRMARASRATICATSCSRSKAAISGIAATAAGITSRSSSTMRIADGTLNVAAGQPGRISAPVQFGPLPPRCGERRSGRTDDVGVVRRRLLRRSERRYAGSSRDGARQGRVQTRRSR